MIIYFADRHLNIIGQASAKLPKGLSVADDLKTEDVETGVAVFECYIPFDDKTRKKVETCAEVGNYILYSSEKEDKFYQIVESKSDSKNQDVYVYAEDDGMDLLNTIVGAYEADKAYPISHYINMYAAGSGFEIGTNEVATLTRKLSWDGETTATERIASIATQFDGCEISYSFKIDGLSVSKKYINIFKERGKDIGVRLRLNQDIDRIVTKKSIQNLATALKPTGATPEDENTSDDVEPEAITLKGYKYDDGDFYVDSDGVLKSREALKRWSRLLWKTDESKETGGHIVRPFSYDTLSQAELCQHTITELKKWRDMEVNYEIDISKLPENAKIGDRVYIVDDAGELYLSSRILLLETSECNQKHSATLGEHLIKGSGISQSVADLAEQFAKLAVSAARALRIATNAKAKADEAKLQAEAAAEDASIAQMAAEAAEAAASAASESAFQAQEKAAEAEQAVDRVEENVASLEETVNNAQAAADNAQQAAETAQEKADEAAQAAANALAEAADAKAASEVAQGAAETATSKAETAHENAEAAKVEADNAKATAEAAKLDAERAVKDIESLGEELETVSHTMQADYARKTDLTETEANLQSQITQNAAQITSTVSQVTRIDETANNAQEQLQGAIAWAKTAQAQADQAKADAQAAQEAADLAAISAANAQAEADTARAAAETAKSVADKAEADLEAAEADLATVTSRADATEEEIAAARQAVEAAQTAAEKAKADAEAAATISAEAEAEANKAVTNAAYAQAVADEAASEAALAQKVADEAKGDATAAQAVADEAAQVAADAQETADAAFEDATNAQETARAAARAAADAQSAADDADARAAQAEADLAEAERNLAEVMSRVDATEEEVAAAQAYVVAAQDAASLAQQEAEAAQATADTAKADAENAQTAANNAMIAADEAQRAADEAQKAADEAQIAVDGLAVRITSAETKIRQNARQLSLTAKKTEVAEMLGGYSTTEEMQAAIDLKADEINLSVSRTYATKDEVEETDSELRETLIEQQTAILADCESIILSAIESRVDGSSYEEFKETVSSQLKVLAEKIAFNFTTVIEQITEVNGELQKEIEERRKHIDFGEDGITIGSSDSAIQMNLDNDQLVFSKNGVEIVRLDINNFTPTNVYIKSGGRLQLGNFGFTVLEDGSPVFGKVGG